MNATNEGLIELIEVSAQDGVYSSVIRHTIADEELTLRFRIDAADYQSLKDVLELQPFFEAGIAPYSYFFPLQYRRNPATPDAALLTVRISQLGRQEQVDVPVSRNYIANILWFNLLQDRTGVELMIEDE